MKIKFLNQKIVCLSILLLFSCSIEDESNEYDTNSEELIQLERKPRKDKTESAPFAVASITGCGYGFKVDMTLFALSSSQQFNYEVWDVSGTNLINSGTVSQGMNTDWVLSPCTTYQFRFWGWPWTGPLTGHQPSQVLTATTDGCGNVFIC
ncbi:hypothetical protein [uncultured Psychroserpens sp.]|uniref:hypothetical protein n=1 Tax=uncultured Psychroserpens sp. TaxID=255436 RepID=UPI0026134A3E|nr:hypothetical protein [uncultured Psychroserpens sp.]